VQKIWKLTSGFIIASLAMPMGVFALPQNVQSAAGQQPAAAVVQTVKVAAFLPNQAVVPQQSNTAAQIPACVTRAVASNDLLQNTGVVNLNQPALCFSLALGKVAAVPSLAVVLMRQTAKVILPSQNRVAGSPSLASKSPAQDTALPSLIFIVSAAVIFEQRKHAKKPAVRFLKNISRSLTLYQLGILRC
jgi:hypothetical protein